MCADIDIKVGEDCIGFSKWKFTLTYLGCPIGHSRKIKKKNFFELFKKVQNKWQLWKDKLLSFGSKVVLINIDLQSISIYYLSIIIPPNVLFMIFIECLLGFMKFF